MWLISMKRKSENNIVASTEDRRWLRATVKQEWWSESGIIWRNTTTGRCPALSTQRWLEDCFRLYTYRGEI